MGKGGYNGGGTVIGPRDQGWYGKGGPADKPVTPAQPPKPLPPEAEQEIASLRRSIKAYEQKIRSDQAILADCQRKLEALLRKYDQPVDG